MSFLCHRNAAHPTSSTSNCQQAEVVSMLRLCLGLGFFSNVATTYGGAFMPPLQSFLGSAAERTRPRLGRERGRRLLAELYLASSPNSQPRGDRLKQGCKLCSHLWAKRFLAESPCSCPFWAPASLATSHGIRLVAATDAQCQHIWPSSEACFGLAAPIAFLARPVAAASC